MAKRGRQATKQEIKEGLKFCPSCDKVKPLDNFMKHRLRARGVSQYCRMCLNAKKKAWRRKNPDAVKLTLRKADLRRKYGISLPEYQGMLEEQDHSCAICGTRHTEKKKLHVDHDHDTGTPRALLCSQCNTSIGMFGDSSEALTKAAAYLKAHGC